MTGLFPHATGVPHNKLVMRQNVQIIAEMVSDDYTRAYFGKWHLGDEVVASPDVSDETGSELVPHLYGLSRANRFPAGQTSGDH
jgi:arylsulfatase A-like enzyme